MKTMRNDHGVPQSVRDLKGRRVDFEPGQTRRGDFPLSVERGHGGTLTPVNENESVRKNSRRVGIDDARKFVRKCWRQVVSERARSRHLSEPYPLADLLPLFDSGRFFSRHINDISLAEALNCTRPDDELGDVISRVIDGQVLRKLDKLSQNETRTIMNMRANSPFAERWRRALIKDGERDGRDLMRDGFILEAPNPTPAMARRSADMPDLEAWTALVEFHRQTIIDMISEAVLLAVREYENPKESK